jgi:hypothetical protein
MRSKSFPLLADALALVFSPKSAFLTALARAGMLRSRFSSERAWDAPLRARAAFLFELDDALRGVAAQRAARLAVLLASQAAVDHFSSQLAVSVLAMAWLRGWPHNWLTLLFFITTAAHFKAGSSACE